MSDVIIVCGGTGGHLSPGIALAEELKERGFSQKLIISKKLVDSKLIKKYSNHYLFDTLPGRSFSGNFFNRILFLYEFIISIPKIIEIINSEKPKVIILFGGFVSFNFGIIASILNQKIILHEANMKIGKAINFLVKNAERIYLPKGLLFKNNYKNKVRYLGYPLRKEIRKIDKKIAREQIDMRVEGKLLVVIGGSQGAKKFNRWVIDNYEKLAGDQISVYCITGFSAGIKSEDEYFDDNHSVNMIKIVPFSENMSAVLSSADLVVSRAGAGSIAEITRCNAPSILIPYPYSSDGHQILNARKHESMGGCIVLDEDRIDRLYDEIKKIIHNDFILDKFKSNLKNMDVFNSKLEIVNDLESNFI